MGVLSESSIFKGRSSPGESQITLGAWEDPQGDQGRELDQEGVNSGVPKLPNGTRVSITNDKQARELHELAQYKENPHQIPAKWGMKQNQQQI